MSLIHDALKRASEPDKERTVIHIPKEKAVSGFLNVLIAAVAFACLAAVWAGVWNERRDSLSRDADLSERIAALDQRQTDFLRKVRVEDPYLDTRVQLEMLELQNLTRTLAAGLDSLAKEQGLLDARTKVTGTQVTGDVKLLHRRLHLLERDNSVLADRIAALKTSSGAEDAAS